MTHFASDKNDFQGVYQFIQLWIPCSLTFFDHGSHEWSDVPTPEPARQCDKHVREVVERKTCRFFSTPVHANYIYIYIPKSIIVPSFSDHSVSKTSKVVFTFLCHYIHHYPFYIQFFSMFLSSVQNLPTISCQRTAQ